jgi:hypothetical protein
MKRGLLLGIVAVTFVFNGLAATDHTDSKKDVRNRLAKSAGDDINSHLQGQFEKCAKACAGCAMACESCFKHCADRVGNGQKVHILTMHLCLDCGELCATGARLSARHSTLAVPTCEACAKACDACAAECEKASSDEHMRACGKTCRACAAACREMIKIKTNSGVR